MAKVGTSALESRELGYLLDSDLIVPHKDELLFVASQQVRALASAGFAAVIAFDNGGLPAGADLRS